MIETIDLKTFEIPCNYLLIRVDSNYNFVEIPTPDGNISLQLNYLVQDRSKYLSISGCVIKAPNSLYFFKDKNKTSGSGSHDFHGNIRNTNDFETGINVSVGDKVYFSYTQQLDAEVEGRLVRTAEHGICMLIKYAALFGKVVGEDIVPLNGWVFFIRDKDAYEKELESGITLITNTNKYGSNTATVISADKPVTAYLEGELEPQVELTQGQRIVLAKGWGHRISYEMGNEELRDVEAVRRKNILAILN